MFFFFFFSSRRRHTRWTGDWSSDVCSSDLPTGAAQAQREHTLLAGPESQRERVPAGDELEPSRDLDQQLEPGSSDLGLERDLERDLVVLEHALAVELEPGAHVRR